MSRPSLPQERPAFLRNFSTTLKLGLCNILFRDKIMSMGLRIAAAILSITLGTGMVWALSQADAQPSASSSLGQSSAQPQESSGSSSRETKIDLSPPKNDAKDHPNSAAAVANVEQDEASNGPEAHTWNPHKAAKDLEVGDFYFRRKNYRAALDRYKEALQFKPDDAVANFRVGECLTKLNDSGAAIPYYQEYLKILPNGPLAKDAEKALAELEKTNDASVKNGGK